MEFVVLEHGLSSEDQNSWRDEEISDREGPVCYAEECHLRSVSYGKSLKILSRGKTFSLRKLSHVTM